MLLSGYGSDMNIKNLSPREISAINAATISLLASVANFVFVQNWLVAVVIFVILFAVSYFQIYSFLQIFIYRRIKLIYKFIYQTKASKKEEVYYKYILPKKSIEEV